MGSPASTVCQHNVDTLVSLRAELGVPIETDKLEGPSTSLSFLGIILGTNRMEKGYHRTNWLESKNCWKLGFPGKGWQDADSIASRCSPTCHKSGAAW